MYQYDSKDLGAVRSSNIFQPGVYHEDRDARTAQDVVLPFAATVNGRTYKGRMFSLERIVLEATPLEAQGGNWPENLFQPDLPGGTTLNMRLLLNGYVFEISAEVSLESDPNSGILIYRIQNMYPQARRAFQRVVRYYFSGRTPDADMLLNSSDGETPVPGATRAEARRKTLVQVLSSAAAIIVLVGVILVAATAIHNKLAVIQSAFATITAPQTTIRSAEQGQVVAHNMVVGQRVSRDETIFSIASPQIDSEIELAKTRLEYVEAVNQSGSTLLAQKIAAVKSDASGFVMTLDPADLSEAGIRQEINLEAGRLKSLELRKAGLASFAPCDCLVAWAEENGSWVMKGDPVAVLVRTGNEALHVEALVNLKQIGRLEIGQKAFVRTPDGADIVAARILRISVGEVRQPRFGFPDWLKKEPTLASVILETNGPLDPDWIGVPVEVSFTRPIGLDLVTRLVSWTNGLLASNDGA